MVQSNVKAVSGRKRLGGAGKVRQGAQRQGEGRIVGSVLRIVVAPIPRKREPVSSICPLAPPPPGSSSEDVPGTQSKGACAACPGAASKDRVLDAGGKVGSTFSQNVPKGC